jgi:hypothetical protein
MATPATPSENVTLTASTTPSATPTVTPQDLERFTGTYDATSTSDTSDFSGEGIATVTGHSDSKVELGVDFGGFTSVGLTGLISPGGSVDLAGFGRFQVDIEFQATGHATISETRGVQRIEGFFDAVIGTSRRVDFALKRPATGTPGTFTAEYHFAFTPSPSGCACDSEATLAIVVGTDGSGTSQPGDDHDAGGTLLGTFASGDCLVSPSGRVLCSMAYTHVFALPPDPFPPLAVIHPRLAGTLPGTAPGADGTGRTEVSFFEALFFGTWTARR